jgi:glutamate-1-semialdehyde aminotransferase
MMLSLHLSLLNHGISARPGGGFFLSTAVTEQEIDRTVESCGKALDDLD